MAFASEWCEMPFPYYDNLSEARKRIYRKSDAIRRIPISCKGELYNLAAKLKSSLEKGKRRDVSVHASEMCRIICEGLDIEPLKVKISTRRPSNAKEELQGLYERTEGEEAVLTVWMKTAAKGQVVAFKSFIRTVLHELCHHIDFTYYRLAESYHTEGFFARESGLYKEIVPVTLQRETPRRKTASKKKSEEPVQLELFGQY